MDAVGLAQSPFAVLTFIAAPALLTNASSVLALSTTNRMLRTRDRMHELYTASEKPAASGEDSARLVAQVARVEQQALLLLGALRFIYTALGSFASATLVTLLGGCVAQWEGGLWFRLLAGLGLALGFLGVGSLAFGSVKLFQATQISLVNLRMEADVIRARQANRAKPG